MGSSGIEVFVSAGHACFEEQHSPVHLCGVVDLTTVSFHLALFGRCGATRHLQIFVGALSLRTSKKKTSDVIHDVAQTRLVRRSQRNRFEDLRDAEGVPLDTPSKEFTVKVAFLCVTIIS